MSRPRDGYAAVMKIEKEAPGSLPYVEACVRVWETPPPPETGTTVARRWLLGQFELPSIRDLTPLVRSRPHKTRRGGSAGFPPCDRSSAEVKTVGRLAKAVFAKSSEDLQRAPTGFRSR